MNTRAGLKRKRESETRSIGTILQNLNSITEEIEQADPSSVLKARVLPQMATQFLESVRFRNNI